MSQFAIIETGGKQYKITSGQKLEIEKLKANSGDQFSFDKVLLIVDGDKVEVGTPYLKSPIEATVMAEGRGEKKVIFKYHSKTRHRKRRGHRQTFTEVEIKKLSN